MAIQRILITPYVWPELTSSASALRTEGIFTACEKAGWKVSVLSSARPNEWMERLRKRGFEVASFDPNDSSVEAWLQKQNPDVAIFDRFVTEEQWAWRIQKLFPNTVRILDTSDLHFLRRNRMADFQRKNRDESDFLREVASIYRSHHTWVVSDFEEKLLKEAHHIPDDLVSSLRFSYPSLTEEKKTAALSFEAREHFVMIGNFRHPPNHDATLWLARELWPEIRKRLPRAEVHVYGAYQPKELTDLHRPELGFHMKGWAKDQFETLSRYRVSLAPLRFGAGIKGKISDSWWVGTSVVTTPIGAEGMTGDLPFGGEVADAPSFVHHAVTLYTDENRWLEAQRRGYRILETYYDEPKLSRQIIETLQKTYPRATLRDVLWYQSNRSTEYFSRWIEAKSKIPSLETIPTKITATAQTLENVTYREAVESDLPAITEIYNHYVMNSTATFDTQEKSVEQQRAWFKAHGLRYPVLVAESENRVLGWASLNPYSDRKAYECTSELSIYIRPEVQGQGIGKKLFLEILESGKNAGIRVVLARITEGNELSVQMHLKQGFETVGTLKKVGEKFGKPLNVTLLQKQLLGPFD